MENDGNACEELISISEYVKFIFQSSKHRKDVTLYKLCYGQ